jgi:ABC-type nitrate/sulfonate/bicarbonate transport system ATPase subunit
MRRIIECVLLASFLILLAPISRTYASESLFYEGTRTDEQITPDGEVILHDNETSVEIYDKKIDENKDENKNEKESEKESEKKQEILADNNIEEYDKENSENFKDKIYNSFDKYGSLIILPLAIDSAIGFRLCGPYCALSAAGLGVLDEIIVHHELTDDYYISWAIAGVGFARNMQRPPYFLNNAVAKTIIDALGVSEVMNVLLGIPVENTVTAFAPAISGVFCVFGGIIGALVSTGKLDNYKKLLIPATSALSGYSIGGMTGGVIGLVVGSTEEALRGLNISDKYYLSNTVSAVAFSDFYLDHIRLGKYKKYIDPVVALAALIWVYYADVDNNVVGIVAEVTGENIQPPANCFEYLSKNTSKEMKKYLSKQYLVNVNGQIAMQLLLGKLDEATEQIKSFCYEASGGAILDIFKNSGENKIFNKLKKDVSTFFIIIVPYFGSQIFSEIINTHFNKKAAAVVKEEVSDKLFDEQVAMRFFQNGTSKITPQGIMLDVRLVVSHSIASEKRISRIISMVPAIKVLRNYPNAIIIPYLYRVLFGKIRSALFPEEYREYTEAISKLEMEFIQNIRQIAESDGVSYHAGLLKDLIDAEAQKNSGHQYNFEMSVIYFNFRVSDIITYILGSTDAALAGIEQQNIASVMTASSNLFADRRGHGLLFIGDVEGSAKRLTEVLLADKIKNTNPKDTIEYVNTNGTNQLVLEDIEIGRNESSIISVKDLRLDAGKVYAITGESGCGKSSFLSKVIKKIPIINWWGKGKVSYPTNNSVSPNIVMISQQEHILRGVSLYTALLYPEKIPQDVLLSNKKQEEVKALLREIGLKKELDVVADKFSGGERKKVAIVSAIIRKPNILILDQTFDDLDPVSVVKSQQMLKKYLPNTLMLIVDHKAHSQNYNGFYDKRLKFSDQTIEELEIKPINLPDLL